MKNYQQHIQQIETGNERRLVVTSPLAGFLFLYGGFMFAELTAFIGWLSYNIHITPQWFQFLVNLQKDPITLDDVIVCLRLTYVDMVVFVKNMIPSLKRNAETSKTTLPKNAKAFVDDPMVQSGSLFDEAMVLEDAGEFEKALSEFDQYRLYHPEDPKAYYELACCQYGLQNYDEALSLVDRAISMNIEYAEAIGLRGLILIEKHEYESAIPNLQYANVMLPNLEYITFSLMLSYYQVCMFSSAMICIKQLLVKRPTHQGYLVYEASLYERLFQSDKAVALMESVVAKNPDEKEHIEMLKQLKERNAQDEGLRYPGMNN